MAKYVQKGEVIDYPASADIKLGDVVSLTNCIGVAGDNIDNGKVGALYIEGVFDIAKEASTTFAIGDKAYYDTTNKCITATNTDVPAGIVVKAAAADDATVRVKIG